MSRYLDDPKPGVDAARSSVTSGWKGSSPRTGESLQPQEAIGRWEEIETVFAHVLELQPDEREPYLAELGRRAPALSLEVRSLLQADGSAGEFLDAPILPNLVGAHPGLTTSAEEPPMPETIGAYQVLSRLGSGGMSDVFLAERSDGGFTQQVAIKLIRAEIVTDELVRRFETERQILAQLAHPNIAGLLDGGRTEAGLPYLVMEYIEGLPIDEYCDSERLTIDQRLDLFLPVCSAVQYAHRNLIVHRDIKTSNILVTRDGTPKLLDFGIAKLLNPESFPLDVEKTATRLRPMTPYYASPEQIENGPITTATDVYSLGVLLYKLLTGQFPHDFEGLHARGVEEKILGEPMVPLVEAIEADASRMASLSAERATKFGPLRRVLAGDLSVVVGMALRKERERRYVSVDQFAADVENYRLGKAVEAHADTLFYRCRRFVTRNRAVTALSAIIVVILFTFGAVTSLQVQRTLEERDRVLHERDRADQVILFLQESFRLSDPLGGGGVDVTAREVLERASLRVSGELANQPDVRAELLDVMGVVFENLGMYAKSIDSHGKAIEYFEGVDDIERAADSLGKLGRAQLLSGDLLGAENSLDRSVALWRESASDPRGLAATLRTRGLLLHQTGDYVASESTYLEALRVLRDAGGEEDAEIAFALGDLAILLNDQGRYEEAEPLFREALSVRRVALGDRHLLVAEAANNLAVFAGMRGSYSEAEPLLRVALEIRHEIHGDRHPDVAESLNNLGQLLRRLGKVADAESSFRQAIATQSEALGDDHARVATYRSNLAFLLFDTGRPGESEVMFRRSIAARRAKPGENEIQLATSLLGLGEILVGQGRLEEAQDVLFEALSLSKSNLSEGHWKTGQSRILLGMSMVRGGDLAGCELVASGLSVVLEDLGSEHRRYAAGVALAKTTPCGI